MEQISKDTFEKSLHSFIESTITGFQVEGDLIFIQYELKGEKRVMVSRSHILLAANQFVADTYFKTPLGSLSDCHTSNKTHE